MSQLTRRYRLIMLLGALWILMMGAGCAQSAAQLNRPASTLPIPSSPTETSTPMAASSTPVPVLTAGLAAATATRLATAISTASAGHVTPSRQSAATATPTRQHTPSPTLAKTASRTSTPTPTASATPTSTPTPALRRLTDGGCCTQPFWSPDSRQVLFIDRRSADAPPGIWGVDIQQLDPKPTLYTSRIATYTSDLAFVIEPDQTDRNVTIIERVADGARWKAPSGGRSVSLSPGRIHVAWQVTNDQLPVERRTTELWVANLDGSEARSVAILPRGSLSGWVNEETLLISSRESLQAREQIISALQLADGTRTELARGERMRGGSLSPDGAWFLYMVNFDPNLDTNGLWIVRTDGTERRQLDRALFGSYRWRDARRLLIIPLQAEAEFHELRELDIETNEVRRLTDSSSLPFKVANGDWVVSPDARQVAFVESKDRNIWLFTLGD